MTFVGFVPYLISVVLTQPVSLYTGPSSDRAPDGHTEKAFFFSFDSSVPAGLRSPLSRAVSEWAEHLHLRPVLVCGSAGLRFRFVSGDHGDGFPFTAAEPKIAHVVSSRLGRSAREVHFSDAVAWKSDGGDPDLYAAALHEIGHALGIHHSTDEASIMYPWYGAGRRIVDSELPPGTQEAVSFLTDIAPAEAHACTSSEGR